MWKRLQEFLAALLAPILGRSTGRPEPEPPSTAPEDRSPQPSPSAPRPSPRPDEQPPPSPPPPTPPPSRDVEPLVVELEKRGSSWIACIEGAEVPVGAEVRYQSRRGLMLNAPQSGYIKYDPNEWRDAYGVWADMIAATGEVEGKCDLCTVNSYDTAAFTFGLMQWAAHTPDDNLVLLLRKLLALPRARTYFPDLSLNEEGRIVRHGDGGVEVLETARSTAGLRQYLNPDEGKVDEAEVAAAAKLIHWVRNDSAARAAMIAFAVEHYRNTVKKIAGSVPLDGKTDVEVLVCADIRHQGRGTYSQMTAALQNARSVEALLEIGANAYGPRVRGLRAYILDGLSQRRFGLHRYNAATGEMVRSEEGPLADGLHWPEAHAVRSNIGRNDQWGVYKLSEPGAPTRDIAAGAAEKVESLRRIGLWLAPKTSRRYQRSGRTKCNIYAYDFVTLAGAYLPRVWWDGAALNAWSAGHAPEVIYRSTEKNVRELTANDLMRWFRAHSSRYGWREVSDVRVLQDHANTGGVAIIVARRRDERASGHIAVVAPEGSTDEEGKVWNARRDGGPFIPVQSQAGAQNFAFGLTGNWWAADRMADHGFWVHD